MNYNMLKYYSLRGWLLLSIVSMATASLFVSCSEDERDESDGYVKYTLDVQQSWENGRDGSMSNSTRDGNVPTALLPEKYWIFADCTTGDGEDVGPKEASESEGFIVEIKEKDIEKYTFIAYSPVRGKETIELTETDTHPYSPIWDIPLYGDKDYLLARGTKDVKVTPQASRVSFTLAHQTAMVRLFLSVSSSYLNLRSIKLKSLKVLDVDGEDAINSVDYSATNADERKDLLSNCPDPLLLFYVNPSHTDYATKKAVIIKAIYDVYDKGPEGDGQNAQLTRKECVAKNKLYLTSIKKTDNTLADITAGKYYDIKITLDPDFLYVLSDNDNKSDLVLQ